MAQVFERCRSLGDDFVECFIVQDDIGGGSLFLGALRTPGTERLKERIIMIAEHGCCVHCRHRAVRPGVCHLTVFAAFDPLGSRYGATQHQGRFATPILCNEGDLIPLVDPEHSTKKTTGKRYRYYLPMRDIKEHAGASGLPRLPAAELESAVVSQLRRVLRAPDLLGDVVPQALKLDPSLDEAQVTVAMSRLDAIWDQLFPAEQNRIVRLLVEKVIVSPNDLEVRLRANGIEQVVMDLHPERLAPAREEALA